jgi:hypothetical protein
VKRKRKETRFMKLRSLRRFSITLVITGLLFAAGGLLLSSMGKNDVNSFKYFGVVFSVMGIGFSIVDKNITELARSSKE